MTPEEQAEVRQRMAARARERAEMAEGPYRRKAVATPLVRSDDVAAEKLVHAVEDRLTTPQDEPRDDVQEDVQEDVQVVVEEPEEAVEDEPSTTPRPRPRRRK